MAKTIEIPHTFQLEHPFKYGEKQVEEIVFTKRLQAKDFKGIKSNDIRFDDMFSLLARMTGNSRSLIEELDSIDLMKAIEVLNSFLPSSPTTGENG
jgi:hypothetical protein